jgi:ferredoxin-thioredoxin reductase catalytic subunit
MISAMSSVRGEWGGLRRCPCRFNTEKEEPRREPGLKDGSGGLLL